MYKPKADPWHVWKDKSPNLKNNLNSETTL